LGDAPRQRIEISRRDLTESEFAKAIKPAPCFAGAHENLAVQTICIGSSALLQELLPKRDVDGVFRRETKIQRALGCTSAEVQIACGQRRARHVRQGDFDLQSRSTAGVECALVRLPHLSRPPIVFQEPSKLAFEGGGFYRGDFHLAQHESSCEGAVEGGAGPIAIARGAMGAKKS